MTRSSMSGTKRQQLLWQPYLAEALPQALCLLGIAGVQRQAQKVLALIEVRAMSLAYSDSMRS